jgi:integrase/recombinase XerD
MSQALETRIEQYLRSQRALGRRYHGEERVLISLCRYLGQHDLTDLDQIGFDGWCRTFPHVTTNVLRGRQLMVRKFCLYRRRYEPDCFVPDPQRFARKVAHRLPVIIGLAEVTRLLAAAQRVQPTPASPLRPAVFRLAVVLLYTAGLRRGELLKLTLADVDAKAGVLRIRESKFHKSRLVPLSADAQRELRRYLKLRLSVPFDSRPDAPLLGNCQRKCVLHGYTGTGLSAGLQALLREAKVQSTDGRRPRVHDFRHYLACRIM